MILVIPKNHFVVISKRKSKPNELNHVCRHRYFLFYLKSPSGPYTASKQLINMMIEELYIMSKFENWTKTGVTGPRHSAPLDESAHMDFKEYQHENHLHWIFLSTRSGITAYWQLYQLANEDHIR
jgi:hypothetical protein